MNAILLPNQLNHDEIKLQTSRKNDIPNCQYYEISQHELNRFPELKKKYPNVKIRNSANPIYNCYGYTFASSRTGIDAESIDIIFKDDEYIEIRREYILPGDIIVYRNLGNIIHTGLVVSDIENYGDFYVVSKWGSFCECVHRVFDCPYNPADISFYRKR